MAGRFFCPDVDVNEYDDEVSRVLRCIVQAVNRLYDTVVEPDGLETASLVLRVNESVRELDAGFASLLSRVERALLMGFDKQIR